MSTELDIEPLKIFRAEAILLGAVFFMASTSVWAQEASAGAYQLGPGDTITVDVWEESDLSGSFVVGEDGTMDYPLLGRVSVVGQSESKLDESLTAALATKYLVDPQVQVKVTAYASQPIQVLGAVVRPGVFHLDGATTVLDIIAKAGGVVESGVSEVRIQHRDPERVSTKLDLEQLVGDPALDVRLAAGDVVFVDQGSVVYVSGEVAKPGAIPFHEGLTVTQALTRAGGTTRMAKLQEVYVLRGAQRIPINVKKILAGRAADMVLRPDDQITLKESVF